MLARKLAVIHVLVVLGLFVIGFWMLFRLGEPREELLPAEPKRNPVLVGPSRANFERLRKGMMLREVESFLGPAGLSYSSSIDYQYYIWKGKDGWSCVWIEHGRVSKLEFDATLSVDD